MSPQPLASDEIVNAVGKYEDGVAGVIAYYLASLARYLKDKDAVVRVPTL